jgi:hypothetical protein
MSKQFLSKPVISAGVMTGTTVLTSIPIDASFLDNLSVQFVWTSGATVSGTLACAVSNDGVTFSAYTVTLPTITASAGGNGIAVFQAFPYKFLRFTYTNSAGSGVLNAYVVGKGS